ncbi:MAG: 5-formyltetrahydrofolate cyclo-ligase [Clostridia bacterium]|jgi:5-formyltetrahydrofolate cyclo-ligase|nr:5-formyltetrahydrofolate cyclo-ligase [Clostridia bacterium]NLS85802.1 5-formyltetrahydrofolate cyclo-ligase [Oscillospiraceae bacterium]
MNKPLLREKMRHLANALPREYTQNASEKITKHLLSLDAFKRAQKVFCFVGTENEIDTRAFLQAVLAENKTLCVPFCESFGVMHAKKITDLSELECGKYGIYSANKSAETIAASEIDFAVIPCLAASRNGDRLGYGGGFYDRYIPKMTAADCLCVCRERLLSDEIISESHDIRVKILTEEGFL